jgi:hypothetical protein
VLLLTVLAGCEMSTGGQGAIVAKVGVTHAATLAVQRERQKPLTGAVQGGCNLTTLNVME